VALVAAVGWSDAPELDRARWGQLLAVLMLAAAARLLVFRIFRDVSVALDSTFYVAASFAFGFVPAALLSFVVLCGEAVVRAVLPRSRSRAASRSWLATVASCLFQGGLPALVLLGTGVLFGVHRTVAHSDLALAALVLSVAATFLFAHYAIAGVGHFLGGTAPREVARAFVIPLWVAELTPMPIGLAMVYGYVHQGLLQFLLIGSSGLLFNWIYRRAHIARAKLQLRVSELSTLNKVGQLLGGSLERRVLIRNIATETLRLVGHSSRLMIGLLRDNSQVADYEVFEESGASQTLAEGAEGALTKWMLANRKQLMLRHAGPELDAYASGVTAAAATAETTATRPHFQSLLAVPLVTYDEVIGVMSVLSEMRDAYTADHLRVLATIADQSAVALENARLYELATVDGLTGLLVRRHFDQRLEQEWRRAQRYGGDFSLGLLDLDNFKELNDTHGHQAGDHALRAAARIVRSNMRATDLAGRYGGEEFVFVLPRTTVGEACTMAERIRADIDATRFDWGGARVGISASLGVAGYPDFGRGDLAELVSQADEALYRAKRSGKNRVVAAPGVVGSPLDGAGAVVTPR